MATPDHILELIEAFRQSKTLFTAVKLGVFDGARPADCKELTRLLEACVALGLLDKRDHIYSNTPEADKYLRSDSPDTLAGYIHYSDEALYPMWAHLEDAVREGTPRWNQTFGTQGGIFSGFFRTEEAKREFLNGMHGLGRISSPAVAEEIRKRYPQLEAEVFDLPEVARLYPGTIAGDFFTGTLPEADLYSLGRILHDWTDEKIRPLLAKIHAALPERGGLLIAEKLLEPGYVGAHMQSLNMLVGTEGRERSVAEHEALLRAAGFSIVESRITGAYLDAVLATK